MIAPQAVSQKSGNFFEDLPSSLNNVTGDAPLPNVHHDHSSESDFIPLTDFAFSSDRESSERDLLNSTLRDNYAGLKFSNKFWDFITVWQDAAERVFNIRNDEFAKYRRWEFENCYKDKARGKVHVDKDNPEKRYSERYHCGEPGCLLCGQLARTRLAMEWVTDYKQIVNKHPGFPGLLCITFTLPEKLEASPLYDKDLQKNLVNAVQRIIRRLFGLKSRANLAMNICVHPIGSSDLKRDRWHVHVIVFPAVIDVDKKTRAKSFRWVHPVHVTGAHSNRLWRIKLPWLRNAWNNSVACCFGIENPGVINPQVKFLPYKHGRSNQEKDDNRFWVEATHRFRYDMRSFAEDTEKAFLRVEKKNKLIVLKVEKDGLSVWDIVDSVTLVERYKFVREHNKVRARGWAQSKKMHSDLLGLVEEDPGEKPECVSSDAEIRVIRKKGFNPEIGRVVLTREEIYRFCCPVTGKDMELPAKEIPKWKW
jgi:hypothetical protein